MAWAVPSLEVDVSKDCLISSIDLGVGGEGSFGGVGEIGACGRGILVCRGGGNGIDETEIVGSVARGIWFVFIFFLLLSKILTTLYNYCINL